MKKHRKYTLSHELLDKYIDAALCNAGELLDEACDLLLKKHYARGYFLACASIEETGKAFSAFSAMGRNLTNPGIEKKVKETFEDHRSKMLSAFVCLLNKNGITKDDIDKFLKLASDLHVGRERSMYVDINDNNEVTEPTKLVRPVAAINAVWLAVSCLETTGKYIAENDPEKFTPSQDKFMTLKKSQLTKMYNTKDFWEYCLFQFTNENSDIIEITSKYHDEYYCKDRLFISEPSDSIIDKG